MRKIDLNCDMGESYGHFKVGNDSAIMPYLTSCNIACGFHGGDPSTIRKTIQLALKHQVKIGAHPSYPDLPGFGRRKMHLPNYELFDLLVYQISAVKGMVESEGGTLQHVKPHGALYNAMAEDIEIAKTILEAVQKVSADLIIYGLANKEWINIAEQMNLPYMEEGFCDRAYTEDLFLVPRSNPNAHLKTVEARTKQVENMIQNQRVKTASGEYKSIKVDTLCIHGDDSLALETAMAIRNLLDA